jgi:hypothetical protein
MNIYLCGPVSKGPRAEAFAQFQDVEQESRRRANDAKVQIWTDNPMRFCPASHEWHEAMRVCVGELVRCDGIALLQGWQESKGAALELRLSQDLQIPVVYIEPPFDHEYPYEVFSAAPETARYYNDRLSQFEKEGAEESIAERAAAELSDRYLDPHGFEYISEVQEHGKA